MSVLLPLNNSSISSCACRILARANSACASRLCTESETSSGSSSSWRFSSASARLDLASWTATSMSAISVGSAGSVSSSSASLALLSVFCARSKAGLSGGQALHRLRTQILHIVQHFHIGFGCGAELFLDTGTPGRWPFARLAQYLYIRRVEIQPKEYGRLVPGGRRIILGKAV